MIVKCFGDPGPLPMVTLFGDILPAPLPASMVNCVGDIVPELGWDSMVKLLPTGRVLRGPGMVFIPSVCMVTVLTKVWGEVGVVGVLIGDLTGAHIP